MKKLLGAILFALVLMIPLGSVQSGILPDVVFGGARYDKQTTTTVFHIGMGTGIGGGLWNFTYVDLGDHESQDASTEVAFFKGFGDISIGVLAGTDVDWETTQDVSTTYFTGLGGVIVAAKVYDKIGLWSFAKYKFSFESDNLYKDGMVFAGGIYFSLK